MTGGFPDAATLAARVVAYRARAAADCWAATALVLGDGDGGPHIALTKRVSRKGDRWSGQVALPGGKTDPEDDGPGATAAREAWEEVGLRLGPSVARLDDLEGRPLSQRVSTALFVVEGLPPLVPHEAEVAAAAWLPLEALADPESRGWYRYGNLVPFPSITVGEYIIWGLTHRILTHFFAVAGLS